MANIDGTEDEVDKMMGQLKVFDNKPLQRYYSKQLEINLSTKLFNIRMSINAEVFNYEIHHQKIVKKRVEHKYGYP